MKLRWLFSGAHFVTTFAGALAYSYLVPGESGTWTGFCAAAAGVSMALGYALAAVVLRGLGQVEAAAAADIDSYEGSSVWEEIGQCIGRIRHIVQRWSQASASSRQQMRQIEQLLELLDRRTERVGHARNGSVVDELRRLLVSLSGLADSELDQILTYSGEVERATQEIAAQAEDQSEAVNRTTTCVEQMSIQFDSVAEHANAAQRAADEARESAASAQHSMQELVRSIEGVRMRVQSAERRLKNLGERSQEISSIVETIGSISSRTDLLALNASIESFRAGEQGRGFSVVAEEVRKLAEQAALATREVSSLIEAIQSETQESIHSMTEQRSEVDAEILRIQETERLLARIASVCDISSGRVREISKLAGHQLNLTQDLVSAVERISDAARQNRSRAENVGWTMKTVSKLSQKLSSTLDPIRACSSDGPSRYQWTSKDLESASVEEAPRMSQLSDVKRESAAVMAPAAALVGSDARA